MMAKKPQCDAQPELNPRVHHDAWIAIFNELDVETEEGRTEIRQEIEAALEDYHRPLPKAAGGHKNRAWAKKIAEHADALIELLEERHFSRAGALILLSRAIDEYYDAEAEGGSFTEKAPFEFTWGPETKEEQELFLHLLSRTSSGARALHEGAVREPPPDASRPADTGWWMLLVLISTEK